MNKKLRPYQVKGKEAVLNAVKAGKRKQLVVMPGGTGKTFLATSILHEFKGRKAWISHEEELAEQSALTVLQEMDIMDYSLIESVVHKHNGLVNLLRQKRENLDTVSKMVFDSVGMVKADVFDIDKPIVICSAQTLWRRLDKIPKDWFSVVVADEGDLFGSKTFNEPLKYFDTQLTIGFTATPYRMDNMLMEDIFEEITYEYLIQDAIKDGYLTEIKAIVVKTSTNLDDVHTLGGDFNQKELTEKVNTLERNNLIVNKYIEYCSGQQFICFAADVQHVIDLNEAFKDKGINTAYVVSDKNRMVIGTDRKQIVRDYRKGEIVGLINHNVLSAGFDHKDCGCTILACPTKSKRKFLQQLFRVTRLKTQPFVDKFGQIGTVLDIVDGTSKHSVINTKELDKGLEIEDRVFTSRQDKDKLLKAKKEREFKTTFRKEDKKVELFKIPTIKIKETLSNSKPATEKQLQTIKKWGYDIENKEYTMKMISEIFASQKVNEFSVNYLKENGYDTYGKFISIAQFQEAKKQIDKRLEENIRKQNKWHKR